MFLCSVTFCVDEVCVARETFGWISVRKLNLLYTPTHTDIHLLSEPHTEIVFTEITACTHHAIPHARDEVDGPDASADRGRHNARSVVQRAPNHSDVVVENTKKNGVKHL